MKSTLTKNQKQTKTKVFTENGKQYKAVMTIRYDDDCGNGHNTFAMTMDTLTMGGRFECGGCDHDGIRKHFPKYAKYIKWHLVSSDEPMHYLANTLYHAGVKDCHGQKKGDPARFDFFVRFKVFPYAFKHKESFVKYLEKRKGTGDFQVETIPHKNTEGNDYKFEPKYSLAGYCSEWYQCPFDDLKEAQEFAHALNTFEWDIEKRATSFSEGKAPQLDAARSSAIWPDATLKELQSEEVLKARLPDLMAEFKADVEELGFVF